jgi:xanthine/uracil permease
VEKLKHHVTYMCLQTVLSLSLLGAVAAVAALVAMEVLVRTRLLSHTLTVVGINCLLQSRHLQLLRVKFLVFRTL